MTNGHNQREFSRVTIQIKVICEADGRTLCQGRVENVSANGVLLVTDNPPASDSECDVLLFLNDDDPAPTVRAKGTVQRADASSAAIQFDTIGSVESWDHLRNLILHNADDSSQAEEEFASHVGIKRRT